MPLAAGSLFAPMGALALFLLGYFVYFAPYYALYPDLVSERFRSRSQGWQGGLRGAGMMTGLAGGGVMLSLWQPLPFVVGAAAVAVTTAVLALRLRGRLSRLGGRSPNQGNPFAATCSLVRTYPATRTWMIANALWEGALAGLTADLRGPLPHPRPRVLTGRDVRGAGRGRRGRDRRGPRIGQTR